MAFPLSLYINVGIDPGEKAAVADLNTAYRKPDYRKGINGCGSDKQGPAAGE